MAATPFAIVGTGWRAEFYLRIAQSNPRRFRAVGLVSRGDGAVGRTFGVETYGTIEHLLAAQRPEYVVSSVPWGVNPGVIKLLVPRGMPVLSETPPAPDLAGMRELYRAVRRRGGKVQVAEQVHLRPHHQAQIALAHSGRLGTITEAYISNSHGYHGISVMRRMLGVRFENATITGKRFSTTIVQGAGRDGLPAKEKLVPMDREIFTFDFGDRLGIVDFTGAQYFGWIRNEHIQIRGTRGELVNDQLRYLQNFRTPIEAPLTRVVEGAGGNLKPSRLAGYQSEGKWIWKNPYDAPGMMDDEIAIADAMRKMSGYIKSGEDFYSLAEGCQDHYFYLLAQEACRTGKAIKSERQLWSE